jgi:cold shock CspA family protein
VMAGPHVHTPMPEDEPEHHGEYVFAHHLAALTDEPFHLWFGVDYLPGVTDLDLLLCFEPVGFFAIEIKAFSIEAVHEYSATHMSVAGRAGTKHPLKQARRAQLKLVEFLRAVRISPPFVYTTAAFPNITRGAFLERFGGTPALRLQIEGMIFAEDLASREALAERLGHARESPPFGAAPRRPRRPSADEIRSVVEAIDPRGKPTASPADIARSAVLRQPVSGRSRSSRAARLARYVQPGRRLPTVFRGYPGTGKTYYLLRIALEHAREGRSVLFLCFNRVLASDIRRMLATTNFPKEVLSRVDVTHAWAFRGRYSTTYVDGDQGVQDELPWIFATHSPLEEYGTVCIDEAQDLPEWTFSLVRWHAEEGAEWFVAHGPGQELYAAAPAPFMAELLESASRAKCVEQLKRVYRTAHVDFLIAQGVYEHAPDSSRISDWVRERPLPAPQPARGEHEQGALFDEPLDAEFEAMGVLPCVVEVPRWSEELAPSDRDLRREALRRVLMAELSTAAQEGRPGDVAVLLRNVRRKDDADDVRWVLDELRVPFVDQIEQSNRDLLLPAGHVRLVSFKSARGIEAHRTVLVGFDELNEGQTHLLRDSRNQAYIALSRAKAGTTVLTRPHRRGGFSRFLVDLVDEYAKQAPEPDGRDVPDPATSRINWELGSVDRVIEDGGYGFIRAEDGSDTFFHTSALLGLGFEGLTGQSVYFTSVQTERGRQATVVAQDAPNGSAFDAQPGYQPGFVSVVIGDRGFGFLLVPSLTKRVFFHINQVADGAPELRIGDRVDVLVDHTDSSKPRAALVAPRV